jgi:TonB family protein
VLLKSAFKIEQIQKVTKIIHLKLTSIMQKFILSLALIATMTTLSFAQNDVSYANVNPAGERYETISENAHEAITRNAIFPGGNARLAELLAENLVYPMEARNKGIEGTVKVKVTLDANGTISQTEVFKSVSPELDAAALKAVNALPKWIPALQNGDPTAYKLILPVSFELE